MFSLFFFWPFILLSELVPEGAKLRSLDGQNSHPAAVAVTVLGDSGKTKETFKK